MSWTKLLVWMGVALALRLGTLAVASSCCPERLVQNDTVRYEQSAAALVELGRFSERPEETAPPETIRTPGYPAFLAVFRPFAGSNRLPPLVAQCLLSTAVIAVLFRLGRTSGHSSRALAVTSALVALDPVTTAYSNMILSDVVFGVALLAFSAWFVTVRQGSLWAHAVAGAMLGLLAWIRPIAYFLPLAALLWILWRNRAALRSALVPMVMLCTTWAVVCLGWQTRNLIVADTFDFTSVTGFNLLDYRAARVVSLRDGIGKEQAREQLRAQIAGADSMSFAEWSEAAEQVAVPILKQNPALTLRTMVEGVGRMYLVAGDAVLLQMFGVGPADGSGALGDLGRLSLQEYRDKWLGKHPGAFFVFLLAQVVNVGVLLGGVVGMWRLWRAGRWKPVHGLFVILILYFSVLSAGPEAEPRFRTPVIPLFAFFAGVGIVGVSATDGKESFGRPRSGRIPPESIPR